MPQANKKCSDCERESCATLTWQLKDGPLEKEVCPVHFLQIAAGAYCYQLWPELGNKGAGDCGNSILLSACGYIIREAFEEMGMSEEQIKKLKGFNRTLTAKNPGGLN